MNLQAELDKHRDQLHAIPGVIGSAIEDTPPRITLYVQTGEDVMRVIGIAQDKLGKLPLQVKRSTIPEAQA